MSLLHFKLIVAILFVPFLALEAVPVISSFVADQTTVTPGSNVTLTWVASDYEEIYLNGTLLEDVDDSIDVSPLVATTYTLEVTSALGSDSAVLSILVTNSPDIAGVDARFVEVIQNDAASTARLHLSEIEVFALGTTPNSADADGTSTNDLVQSGNPSTVTPPTTTILNHGEPSSVFDGDLESAAEVWSTQDNLGVASVYMLDLGATSTIGEVRLFSREDGSATRGLENFSLNLYADDGFGNPGALAGSISYPGTAPRGGAAPVEFSFTTVEAGITSFAVDRNTIAVGEDITFSWEVSASSTNIYIDNGVGDLDLVTDQQGAGSITVAGPTVDTTYILVAERPNGTNAASIRVKVTDKPILRDFTADAAIIAPGDSVELSWGVIGEMGITLNGVNVKRLESMIFTPAATTTYELVASNFYGITRQQITVKVVAPGEPMISEFLASNAGGLSDEDGEESDWIELYNPTATTVNLSGYYLTDDPLLLTKWELPAESLTPGEFLLIFASGNDRRVVGSELHTNFSLDRGGDYLALVKPDGTTIVADFQETYPEQETDISYGYDEAAVNDGYFLVPTPGTANSQSASGFVRDTTFSLNRGFYSAPISVAITSATVDADIRYTVDGSKPSAVTGQSYVDPIIISETTVLRAAAFKSGLVPTNVDTQTYIFTADVVTDANMDTSITQNATYASQMESALTAVPTISLVFDGDIDRIEKEVSIEMINFEAGDTQVEAGMERFGNYNTNFSKRSMRFNFRDLYGSGKLNFPIFEGHDYKTPPSDQFDGFELRSGNHDMSIRGAYMSNRFTDDTLLDMGHIAPHGRFVHVYLNGLYWGQYHLRERWNAAMLSEYYGGSKDDYEAINANNAGGTGFQTGTVYDGTGEQWTETQALLNGETPFASVRSHLDIPNIIDFMLLWTSGNSESEFRAAGSVPLGVPFKFYLKDADGYLRSSSRDVNEEGPLNARDLLRDEGDPDYEILLADRIHKHFFNDGAFTPAKNIERLQDRVDEIQLSFLGESARWGEQTPQSWQAFQDNLIGNHFPTLTSTIVTRLKEAGMYPSLDAPVFNQHGGDVASGFPLTMVDPVSTVYYTLDGRDPREWASPVGTRSPLTVLTESAGKLVYIPATTSDGLTDSSGDSWSELSYDDSAWIEGSGGVGFETDSGYETYFDFDIESQMHNQNATCLIRIPFDLAAGSLSGRDLAELRIRYDDGFVAYLNGVEVARRNFASTPNGLSNADGSHDDAAAVTLEVIDISGDINLLNDGGNNLLAIHGLNRSTGSSDFLISADLVISDSGTGGTSGDVSDAAIAYTGAIQIDESTLVRARSFDGSAWSALNEAFFTVNAMKPVGGDLVISELHYNGYESGDPEFIEFYNNASYNLIMDSVRIVDGVTFEFPENFDLKSGERIVVVSDLDDFDARYRTLSSPWYHSDIEVAGEFSGSLSGSGEQIIVEDSVGSVLLNFEYNDSGSWPGRADGNGSSLELASPAESPTQKAELYAYLDSGDHWQASSEFHGSPGWAGLGPDNRVVFNEVLPHTDLPLKDSFELYNTTGSSINISGWLISDEESTYAKFQVPNGTNISANGFIVYDEDDFNDGDNLIDFALSSSLGDDLYLVETDAGSHPIRFVDHVRFDPSKNGEAFGRWPDGDGKWYPMLNRTLGQLNSEGGNTVRTGPVVISEIHYSPLESRVSFEFIEIFNAGSTFENLVNWRLRGEADFDFEAEQLSAGATLVITSFDPIGDTRSLDRFLAEYPKLSSAQIRGPWEAGTTNRLNNAGAEIKLQRPDTLEVPDSGDPFYPMLVEDTVNYDDASPWPVDADGTGASLERIETAVYGDLATNWQANTVPSPGRHNLHAFNDYFTWTVANYLGTESNAHRDGDFDFDGYSNLIEFALGQDPRDGSTAMPFNLGFDDLTVASETAQYLTVDLQHRLGLGLTVEVLASSDLETWVPLVDEYSASVDEGNDIERKFYRDVESSDVFPNRFIKIVVTED
ncbi:MAG: lamin tail domain-containing protein [Opitutaceae bacterium]